MIRRRLAVLAAGVLTAGLAGCAGDDPRGGSEGAPAAAGAVADGTLRVGLDDYEVRLGADAVTPGELRLEVVNVGGDAHDLRVDAGGQTLAATEVLARGEEARLVVDIPARVDEVELWCTLPGHRSQGMAATAAVEAPADPDGSS